MDVNNDPRFFSNSVIAKRLAAFQTISVVAVLMVNLSVKEMLQLRRDIKIHDPNGVVQYIGFILMTLVFLMNLTTVVVLIQQLFMTYRLLTVGPTGFEIAKSYYLNPNIVTMRHVAVKFFFYSLPTFVASSGCSVWVTFVGDGSHTLAIPVVILLGVMAVVLWGVNWKHSSIFKERYALAKAHEQPLLTHVEHVSNKNRLGWFLGIDV